MAGSDTPEPETPAAGLTAEQALWAAELGLGLAASRFPGDVAVSIASAERASNSLAEQAAVVDALLGPRAQGDGG